MAEATLDGTQDTLPVAAQGDQDLGIQPPSELTEGLPDELDSRSGFTKAAADFFEQPVVKQALPAIILVTVIAICFLFYAPIRCVVESCTTRTWLVDQC